MAGTASNRLRSAYVAEVTAGTTPATPAPAPVKVEITKEEREKIGNDALANERKRIDGIRESAKRFSRFGGVTELIQKAEREGHDINRFNNDFYYFCSSRCIGDT